MCMSRVCVRLCVRVVSECVVCISGYFTAYKGTGADWLHSGPPGNDSCWGPSQPCLGRVGPLKWWAPGQCPSYCPYGQSAPTKGKFVDQRNITGMFLYRPIVPVHHCML